MDIHLRSTVAYGNPLADVAVWALLDSPEGRRYKAYGFWDGGSEWVVRFAPPVAGLWKWRSASSDAANAGLHGRQGEFTVERYQGDNPIYRHGFLTVAGNRRGFAHRDGTPFFWLGDTAWAAPARCTLDEWQEYSDTRSRQGFNVVQVNSLPQHDASGGDDYRLPFRDRDGVWDVSAPEPHYFRHIDRMLRISTDAGMFAAMVVLWFDYVAGTNPEWGAMGTVDASREATSSYRRYRTVLPPFAGAESASRYARYLAARYGAFGVVWIVSGDSDFSGAVPVSIYDAAANAILDATTHEALVTAHLNGGTSTPEQLNARSWLTFHMYQSSHKKQSYETSLEYARKDRQLRPPRPVLNGEPAYERMGFHRQPERIGRAFVRRVCWSSVLGGGNAGITYGAHGLWSWHRAGEVFEPADAWQQPDDWRAAVNYPGAGDMARLREFFERLPWWELEPATACMEQHRSAGLFAASAYGEGALVLYADASFDISPLLSGNSRIVWYNPENGDTWSMDSTAGKGKEGLRPPWRGDAAAIIVPR